MRWRLRQFVSIAGLTALEALRQPFCLLLTTACVVVTALLPMLIAFTLGEGEKLVRDSGLALYLVCGVVLGTYAACSTLSHEIRRGTVSSVLSKPVGRGLFFLAKYAGVALLLLVFSAAALAAVLLSTVAASDPFRPVWWASGPLLAAPAAAYALAGLWNFFTRRPFASAAFALLVAALAVAFVLAALLAGDGETSGFGSSLPLNLLPAGALLLLALLVLAGLAVSLATRLDTVPTLFACSLVLLGGLMSDYLFGRHAADHAWAAFLYRALPNWQHFWVIDALSGDLAVPWSYVGRAAVYAVLYLAGVLTLGILAFRQMEVRA